MRNGRDAIACDGGNVQVYTLMIDMPWRPVSKTVRAADDRQAAAKAAEMVSSTCTQIDGLGEYRTRLTRADGSDVFEPISVAALIART